MWFSYKCSTKCDKIRSSNKIGNISSLIKKTDYNTKITEIEKTLTHHDHDKYITTPEFNKLSADVFDTRLVRASLNQKINSNKTKHLLVKNELKKLKTFDSIYFKGKGNFEKDSRQNYLVFHPIYRHFKRVADFGSGNYIYFWKSKWLSDENIAAPTTAGYSLIWQSSYFNTETKVEFKGSCLKQDKITFDHGKVVNICIVYKINKNFNISSYPTLENYLFLEVSLIRYKYW